MLNAKNCIRIFCLIPGLAWGECDPYILDSCLTGDYSREDTRYIPDLATIYEMDRVREVSAYRFDTFTTEMQYLDEAVPDRSYLPHWSESQAACDAVFAQAWADMLREGDDPAFNYQGLLNFVFDHGHQFVSPPAVAAGTMDYQKFYYTLYVRTSAMGPHRFGFRYSSERSDVLRENARQTRGPVWPEDTPRIEFTESNCTIYETGRQCWNAHHSHGYVYSPYELLRLNNEAIADGYSPQCHEMEF